MEGKIINFKLSLCLIKHHVLPVYVELKVQVHLLLTSSVGGVESWDSGLGRFTLADRTPGILSIVGWLRWYLVVQRVGIICLCPSHWFI